MSDILQTLEELTQLLRQQRKLEAQIEKLKRQVAGITAVPRAAEEAEREPIRRPKDALPQTRAWISERTRVFSTAQAAKALDCSTGAMAHRLAQMVVEGLVERVARGSYRVVKKEAP